MDVPICMGLDVAGVIDEVGQMGREMIALLADQKIVSMINKEIPLDEVPVGLKELAGRHFRGKMVARITT